MEKSMKQKLNELIRGQSYFDVGNS
jgi:hypothetical protein